MALQGNILLKMPETNSTTVAEDTEKKAKLKEFWIKFALWTLFACLLPIIFIVWRYDLFTKATSIQFGGWGLLAIVILCVFVFAILRYVGKAFSRWSMTKQVILGIAKIIVPLVALYAALYSIRNSIDLFLQALAVVIACETIAIPINPFPKWVYEQTQGQTEDIIDYALAKRGNNTK